MSAVVPGAVPYGADTNANAGTDTVVRTVVMVSERVQSPSAMLTEAFVSDLQQPRRLTSSDSSIVYELPANFPLPFAMGLSFRTRQKDFAGLSAEFTNRRRIALKVTIICCIFSMRFLTCFFQIVNKHLVIEHGTDQFTVPYHTSLSDGNWHTLAISVAENHLNATIDYLHSGVSHHA